MPAQTTQVAPAQQAGQAQPQTTVEAPGGPFIRYANAGSKAQYVLTAQAYGATITSPLVAVPGYLRKFRLRFVASGGSGTATVATAADAPYSAVSFIQLKDAFGTPLLTGDGYSMLKLVPKYSGGHYLESYNDPASLPSWSAVSVGASASGNFTFQTAIPLEFAKGYGCISMANASLLPTLQINLAASSSVYSTAPTTVPTLEIDNYSEFYWLPQQQIEPPGLGSTRQFVLQVANPTIGSTSSQQVTFPRLGGYIDMFILVLRDSTNARIDAWPTEIRLYVDGIPLIQIRTDMLYDDMANQYQYNPYTAGTARETGVIVLTRKTSLGQLVMGLLDSLETTLSTNPGSSLAVEGMPWGTVSNAPATLSVIAGQIVPSGRLLQGLPEI